MSKINMLYNYLGNSGISVSRLGFGTWGTFGTQVDEELGYQMIKVLKYYKIDCI